MKEAPDNWNTAVDGTGQALPADDHTGATAFAKENYYVQYQAKTTSAVPNIIQPVVGDTAITGTGVPGATVEVTVHWQTETITISIPEDSIDGTWHIDVPVGTQLEADQTVTASQTEPGKLSSADVEKTVVDTIVPITPDDPATEEDESTPNPDVDRFVKVTLSDGDGTFADTVTTEYWVEKGETAGEVFDKAGLSATEATTNLTAPTGQNFANYTDEANAVVAADAVINAAATYTAQFTDMEESATPTINQPVVGDNTITGTGVPGAEVTVTLPWQTEPITVTVIKTEDPNDPTNGTWSIPVPDGTDLTADDTINATQLETGKTASDAASATVVDTIVPIIPDDPATEEDESTPNPDADRFVKVILDDGEGTFATDVVKEYWVAKDETAGEVFAKANLSPTEATTNLTAPAGKTFANYTDAADTVVAADTVINAAATYTAQFTDMAKSAMPTINQPVVGDTTITGTGVPGATVTITVPWQDDAITVTVIKTEDPNDPANGTWSIQVPDGTDLTTGDIITATQLESGKTASDAATATVVDTIVPITPDDPATEEDESTPNPDTDRFVKVILSDGEGTFADTVITEYWVAKGEAAGGLIEEAGLSLTEVTTNLTAPTGQNFANYTDTANAIVAADTVINAEATYTAQFTDMAKSATPTINQPVAGDTTITGTGVPSATVTVTLEDGTTLENIPVTADPADPTKGIWTVTVPADKSLAVGDTITATQKESTKAESDPVQAAVIDQPAPEPSLTPNIIQPVVGDPTVNGTGVPGATIDVTIPGVDEPISTTVEDDGTWTIDVPDGVALQADDEISATQTETGKATSTPVTATVIDQPGKEQSATPDINQPVVGDDTITGSGEPGATVTVTLQDGTTLENIPVTADPTDPTKGVWTVDVPVEKPLAVDDTITATQTEPEKEPSIPGTATVVDQPEAGQSPTPQITQPVVGDTTITGTGEPEATIEVTLPDNNTQTTTVEMDGTWTVNVPDGLELQVDDIITATQTVTEQSPSIPGTATVVDQPSPGQSTTPDITQPVAGDTTIDGTGIPGSTIEVIIPGVDEPILATVQDDGTWTVDVPPGITLTPGDTITATQTEPGKEPSKPGTAVVVDQPTTDQSAAPIIDTPEEDDRTIIGEGVPGATITVTIPGADAPVTTTVDRDGTWAVPVPTEIDLTPGTQITAVQTESNKNPSTPATTTVLPHIIPDNTPDDDSDKPEGYVTITFAPGDHGKLTGITTYYVNPEAGKTYADLTMPGISPSTGYKVANPAWAPNVNPADVIGDDATHTAQYVKRSTGGGGGGNDDSDTPTTPAEPPTPSLNVEDHYAYLIGYPEDTFGPTRQMTRAEVATMFTRLLMERPIEGAVYTSNFNDVTEDAWYYNTVGYAAQNNIVKGYPDGSFRPNQPVTRAEFAAIASRFAALTNSEPLRFNDLSADHWAYDAVMKAATHGWIGGYPDGTFKPEQQITRAEVTAITNRMLNRHADRAWIDAHPEEIVHYLDVVTTEWYYDDVMEATMGHDYNRLEDGKAETWFELNGKDFI